MSKQAQLLQKVSRTGFEPATPRLMAKHYTI